MIDIDDQCIMLARTLTAGDATCIVPDPLPVPPLALLICLHQEVTRTMLVDLAYARRAATIAAHIASRFPDDALLQAQAQWTQGSAILFLPDYATSLHHYDAALRYYTHAQEQYAPDEPPRDIRVVQIVRVFCLSELGRYREAEAAVAAAEQWLHDHPNDQMRLALLGNQNQLAGAMACYVDMVRLADDAIALAAQLNNPARLAYGWINRAHACIALGRFEEAEVAINHGLAAAERADEPLTIARAHYNRARLLRYQGRFFVALTTLGNAARGFKQALNETATIALEEAAIYEQLWQFPEALQAARQAATLFAQQQMSTYSAEAALKAAHIAIRQGQSTTARKLLDLARIQAKQSSLPFLQAEITLADAQLTSLTAMSKGLRTAARLRRAARTAVIAAITDLQEKGLAEHVSRGQLMQATLDSQLGNHKAALASYNRLLEHYDPQIRLTALAELGALLPPHAAIPYLEQATQLVTEQRRALPMEELQARYSSETSPYHLRLAQCYLALGDVVTAYECVCAAKAGTFLDLRAAGASLDQATITLLEAEKADIARLRERIHEHRSKAYHAAGQAQHERQVYHTQQAEVIAASLRVQEQALTASLRGIGERFGQASVPAFATIQHTLSPTSALIEYVMFDTEVGCFLVQADVPPIYRRLGTTQTLVMLIDRWNLTNRRLVDDKTIMNGSEQMSAALAPLWQLLVAPWLEHLEHLSDLIIAPWGLLHHIPWAALGNEQGFLGEQVRLTLTISGAVYAAPGNSSHSLVGPPRLLGYAGTGTQHLTHVLTELGTIAPHLPDADVYPAATAANLRASPPPRILHIAAHGEANAAAPLCSTIELADGPFLLLEAHRLNLHGTQLVVLSACETAVRPDSGDMPLALAGAFLCAGAAMVLASLWRVSDAAAAQIMAVFYHLLATGIPPSAALQQAQAQVRPQFPLDWATFQLWAAACSDRSVSTVENLPPTVKEV